MFVIEFSYKCEVIEKRHFNFPPIIPRESEKIYLEFTNENYNEYGFWWNVIEVHHYFHPANLTPKPNGLKHLVRLYIEPDKNKGLAKNDPLFKS